MADNQADAMLRTMVSFSRLQRAVNIDIDTHEDGSWFMRIPGFKYDDFNRAGQLSIVKMDRLSQNIVVMKADVQLGWMMMFMVGRHWTFSSRLYQQAAVNFPMKMHWALTGIGIASLDQHVSFYEDSQSTSVTAGARDREPLATCVMRLVNVDPMTRKPAPLPDVLTSAARHVLMPDGRRFPSFRQPTVIPDNSYHSKITVRYDDTDILSHSNVSSYLGFALECASMASKAGFYSAIDDDVAFFRAKKATSIFISESRAGDVLDVATWEDSENRMLLNFAVSKDGKITRAAICQKSWGGPCPSPPLSFFVPPLPLHQGRRSWGGPDPLTPPGSPPLKDHQLCSDRILR